MKRIIAILGICGLLGMSGVALANGAAQIGMTVGIKAIGISVSDGAVNFGSLALATSKKASALTDLQTVSNVGTVTVRMSMKATNPTDWQLVPKASLGAVNKFALQEQFIGKMVWFDVPLTMTQVDGGQDIGPGAAMPYDFEVTTPTSTSNLNIQNFTVDLLATEV